ncbi:peptidase M24, structural domain-containing protein [Mycena leptocephala]|nr:peptidase M24, structural domain-containing protein [Mycena leptocephala]
MTTCQNSECPNGNPPSRLECPTCNKIGIRGSFFCGQDCFKAGCESKNHKVLHNLAKLDLNAANKGSSPETACADGTYNPFPNYDFTGPMRPIPDHIPLPDHAIDGRSHLLRRPHPGILNAEEIEKMRTVCRMSREVLDLTAAAIRPGITTDEIDEIVHNATIERDAYPSDLNHRKFPKSVCTSVNEVICHGIPDQRKLREGDIINLDVSVYYQGFHGDLNGTYPVGQIDEGSAKLIRTTRKCLDKAIEICKPGAFEPIARSNGCTPVRTYIGHGINSMFHDAPDIPHYAKNKAVGTMKPGIVFTIEPMINPGSNWNIVH